MKRIKLLNIFKANGSRKEGENNISLATNPWEEIKFLYPLCRSLISDGTRKTLDYLEKKNEITKREFFKSGRKIGGWTVPDEWVINDAYLEHIETGKRFAEFKKSNLHIMGYSEPYDGKMTKEELESKIYTLKDFPEATPYSTSYYRKDWCFCMSHNEWMTMPKGLYNVKIDSDYKKTALEISQGTIRGELKNEILFSSYVCHPSMCNNELSGPIVLNAIARYIRSNYKKPILTYRFALVPETIGTICFLSKYGNRLKKRLLAGFNLSCIGDERDYSYVQTPDSNTLADEIMRVMVKEEREGSAYTYMQRGSDERQYCSPKMGLPVVTVCRSKFGTFKEYHTSKDDMTIVTKKGLEQSIDLLKTVVDAIECCLYPQSTSTYEPFLRDCGLIGSQSTVSSCVKGNVYLNIIALSNGKRSIFEICSMCNIKVKEGILLVKKLKEKGLVSNNNKINKINKSL